MLLEALDQILPLEDKEIAKACAREIAKQNVQIVTGAKVEARGASGDGVTITVDGDERARSTSCASPPAGAPTWRGWGWRRPAWRPTTAAW